MYYTSFRLIQHSKFFKHFPDGNVLRTVVLAQSAPDALRGFAVVQGIPLILHIVFLAGHGIQVQQAEIIRDCDVLRTDFHAIAAAGARYFDSAS